ncbi:hypothetical protein JB92DRAFT_3134735 [Gautieria morchelliformis]|nr:hypothetical protein JB92DRAFT_3134735 [Gautieria morchelliformis]
MSTYKQSIRESFSGLLEKVSTRAYAPILAGAQSTSLGTVTSIRCEDYPLVPFWMHGEWGIFKENEKKAGIQADTRQRGRQKDRSQPNKALAYITNTEGVGIDGYQAHAICDNAWLVWTAIATRGCVPPTWSQAHLTCVQYYCQHMYNDHPILRLCEGNWKVDLLAIDEYLGWYRPRKDNLSDIKPEPENMNISTSALAPPILNLTKRRQEGTDCGAKNPKPTKLHKVTQEPSMSDVRSSAPQISDDALALPQGAVSAQHDGYQSAISDSSIAQAGDDPGIFFIL